MTREITALDITGEVREINLVNSDSSYIHKYSTTHCLDQGAEEIISKYEKVKGVNEIVANELSGHRQYEFQVSIEDKDALRNPDYRKITSEITSWTPTYSTE